MSIYNKIFGIGLSKTGTTSLNSALNMLNLKSIHCPMDDITYSELICGKYDLAILQEYDAITDIVVSPFYIEFDKTFPNSLFILTVRDKEDWLRSMKIHIEQKLLNGSWLSYLKSPKDTLSENSFKFARMCSFLHSVNYGCLAYCEERLGRVFDMHIANVKEYFKGTNKLLILDICHGDGWSKLCSFLHKNQPNTPFPHENKTSIKSIDLVHLLCVPEHQREKDSVECLQKLQSHVRYIKHLNPPYTEKPPVDNCHRPLSVVHKHGAKGQLWCGHYGAFLAHKRAVLEEFNSDFLLICECDCYLNISHSEFINELNKACDFIEKQNIAYMSFGNEEPNITYSNHDYTIVSQIFKTHCILFPRSSKEFLVNAFHNCAWDNIDFFYNRIFAGQRLAITNKVFAKQIGNSLIDQHVKFV